MKLNRIVCSLIIVLLLGFSWFTFASSLANSGESYSEYLAAARNYNERQLYQMAIQNYEAALSIKETADVRQELVEASQKAYDEGSSEWQDYVSVLAASCSAQPDNAAYWEALLTEEIENGTYAASYSYAKQARASGAQSTELSRLINDAIYAYWTVGYAYQQVITAPTGESVVYDGVTWGALDADGDKVVEDIYLYVSPANSAGEILLVSERWAHVIDQNGVAQATVNQEITEALAYGDGFIPVKNEDETWSFLNCENGSVVGSYEAVSSYVDGIALVKTGGQWTMVDTEQSRVNDQSFDNVKLHENGAWINGGIMIASQNGAYGMYDSQAKRVCDFTARDMDVYMGDDIAYQDASGKWGYVDTEGNVAIEPQYENAKSFSQGLAAVYKDELWGFINQKGELCINNQYYDVKYFNAKGRCFVSNGGWQQIELLH